MKTLTEEITALYQKRLNKLKAKLEQVKEKYPESEYGIRGWTKQEAVNDAIIALNKEFSAFMNPQVLKAELEGKTRKIAARDRLIGDMITLISHYDAVESEKFKKRWGGM